MGGGGVRGGEFLERGDDFVEGSGFLGDSEEFDGTGDAVFGERGGCVWEQVDLTDAVAVIGFGEGEGDGASGVDEAMGGVGLGAVEVAECDVLEFCGEGGGWEFFAVADDDGAFGISATEAGLDGAVAHGEDAGVGIAGGFEVQGLLGGGVVEGGDAFEVGVVSGGEVGEVGDAEEGDGKDEDLDGA